MTGVVVRKKRDRKSNACFFLSFFFVLQLSAFDDAVDSLVSLTRNCQRTRSHSVNGCIVFFKPRNLKERKKTDRFFSFFGSVFFLSFFVTCERKKKNQDEKKTIFFPHTTKRKPIRRLSCLALSSLFLRLSSFFPRLHAHAVFNAASCLGHGHRGDHRRRGAGRTKGAGRARSPKTLRPGAAPPRVSRRLDLRRGDSHRRGQRIHQVSFFL